jgi:hypothetical protein
VEKTLDAISATLIQLLGMIVNRLDTPRIKRKVKMVMIYMVGLNLLGIDAVNAVTKYPIEKDYYKLYSHNKLTSAKQYLCLDALWTKESQWNPKAKNPKSSAYGIPQLLKLKVTDPYRQIDLGLKYIAHRYGTPCKALAYHLKTGHY